MDIVMYNKFGGEIARDYVRDGESPAEAIVRLIEYDMWFPVEGDCIKFENSWHED